MEQESTEQKAIEQKSIDLRSTDLKQTGSGSALPKSAQKTVRRSRKRKKTKRRKKAARRLEISVKLEPKSFLTGMAVGVLLTMLVMFLLTRCSAEEVETSGLELDASEPEISVQLLDVNDYSRPGTEVDSVSGVVIHYTANPGSTAQQNRDYFNSLQDGHGASVSSHFIVGLDGEIVQCIPTQEVAYASNERNRDTVSIVCCDRVRRGPC